MPTPKPVRVLRMSDPDVPARVEETQVADPRNSLSPSQQVEQRVIRLLAHDPAMVSQMQRQLNRCGR